MRTQRQTIRLSVAITSFLVVSALGSGRAAGQFIITEIIDATGDGAGNSLDGPRGITIDTVGNTYIAGWFSNNAFKITPAGVITEIIDATGDGMGNSLDSPAGIAVDAVSNAFVTCVNNDRAFKITPAGDITLIIHAAGDGAGNGLDLPFGLSSTRSIHRS